MKCGRRFPWDLKTQQTKTFIDCKSEFAVYAQVGYWVSVDGPPEVANLSRRIVAAASFSQFFVLLFLDIPWPSRRFTSLL